MALTSIETRPTLAPAIPALLGTLRRRIRCYVSLEGIATAMAWLGVAFWSDLAIDWLFEPPAAVRGGILVAVVLVFGGVLIQLIGRRTFVRLSDSNMAMLLEQHFPKLNDSLLTAVVLTARQTEQDSLYGEMLSHTCRQAGRHLDEIQLGKVFNPVPLRRSITAAVLFVLTIGAFAYRSPEALGTWARRSLLLHDELWPRMTHLEVDGFDDGVKKVARGADFELIVKADTTWPRVPDVVHVRYHAEGGARRRATMNRLGLEGKYQKYSYTFQGILAPIDFDVLGGDDRLNDMRIEVVESPTIEMELDLVYPAYMDRTGRTLPVSGSMPVPQGTQVTVRARANKDLMKVRVEHHVGKELLRQEDLGAEGLAADPRRFQHVLKSLDEDTTLLFTLSDTDEITTRKPIRLDLRAVADEPPQFAETRLDGIGQAITAQARLPAVGRVSDDYGIDKLAFVLRLDQQSPTVTPIRSLPSHTTELNLDAAMEVRELQLTPDQTLTIAIRATDRCALGEEPNVATGEFGTKQIVTADRLRAMLESQELMQRQRFESIIQEVTETRKLLLRIDFDLPAGGENADNNPSDPRPAAGAEPGDQPKDEKEEQPKEPSSPEQLAATRTLQVERALQNSRKNAHETLAMADAIDDIRKQLINNRIDTEELNTRLKQGIADPLHRIAEEMFPELHRRLEEFRTKVTDDRLGRRQRDLARQQADAILLQMRKVLDRMLELEDFNEALELLRSIIELQKDLGEQTRQRQKQKLLED